MHFQQVMQGGAVNLIFMAAANDKNSLKRTGQFFRCRVDIPVIFGPGFMHQTTPHIVIERPGAKWDVRHFSPLLSDPKIIFKNIGRMQEVCKYFGALVIIIIWITCFFPLVKDLAGTKGCKGFNQSALGG